MIRCALILATGALVAAASPAIADTITPVSTQGVSFPAHANSMTFGPDGNVWLVDRTLNIVGRLSLSGAFTPFPIPTAGATPWAIVSGADGNLWFTETSTRRLGKVTTAGVITELPLPAAFVGLPWQIAATPDGNIWFLEGGGDKHLGRLTPDGTFKEFTVTGAQYLGGLAVAAGYLWAVDPSLGLVFRIQADGTSQSFPTNGASGYTTAGGVEGPDGNLWFTHGTNAVARMTPAGVFTEFSVPTSNAAPALPTVGPDGNIWFSEYNAGKIGQLVVSTATSGGSATINETANLASGPADLIFLPATAFAESSVISRGPASGRTGLDSSPCNTVLLVRADEERFVGNLEGVTIPGPSSCADLEVTIDSKGPRAGKDAAEHYTDFLFVLASNFGKDDAGAGTLTITLTPPVAGSIFKSRCVLGSQLDCTRGDARIVCAFSKIKYAEQCFVYFGISRLPGFNDIQFVDTTVGSVTFDPIPTNNKAHSRADATADDSLPPDVPSPVGGPIRRGPH